jgi:hypothetical protein
MLEKAFDCFKVFFLLSLAEIDGYHEIKSVRLLESRTGYFLNKSRKRYHYKNLKTPKQFTRVIDKGFLRPGFIKLTSNVSITISF